MPDLQIAPGVRLHFTDQGPVTATAGAPAVLLAHSFLASGEMWRHQVGPLAEEHRVVNVDLRGHGRSGPAEGDFTLYDLVDDHVAILDHLGIGRAVWAGLSIGGMIGLRAALRHPDRVAGLLLLDTHAGAERPWVKVKYRALGLGARFFGIRPFLPTILPLMFGSTSRRERPELVAEWRERVASVHLPSILRVLDALVGRDSVVDRLGDVAVPARVLVGEEDATLPLALAREIAHGLPDAALVQIPAAGHLASLERPRLVTAQMLDFLRGLRG